MNIVITMAGMGSRFKSVGYQEPKYMIMAKKKSLFYWSLISLRFLESNNAKYIFIVRRDDNASEFIIKECEALNIKSFEIVELDHLTDGQATTVLYAEPYWNPNKPLLIYNIDSHVSPHVLKHNHQLEDGWIPCFNGPGEKWSFVKVDDNGVATEVREKKRISDNATIGLYWFSSPLLYSRAYNTYYSQSGNEEKGERYIAPLYNQLIKDGLIVSISNISEDDVHILGTPEELEHFIINDYNL